MSTDPQPLHRSALLSFRFLGTAVAGSVVMALVCVFGTLSAQLAILGSFVSILGGLFVSYLAQDDRRERERAESIEALAVPLALARDPELFRQYRVIAKALVTLSDQPALILRQAAVFKIAVVADQITQLAAGRVTFAMSEGWRTLYEQLLASPAITYYKSIAWVTTADYWQDAPGRQSMKVNFDAAHRGVRIERIVILRDHLWHADELLPSAKILPWIEEQHNHGLWVMVVRESELTREPDLLEDIGIYGDQAVGTQELDDRARTLRFTLELDRQAVRLAEDHWRRLKLYATSLSSLLDQDESKG